MKKDTNKAKKKLLKRQKIKDMHKPLAEMVNAHIENGTFFKWLREKMRKLNNETKR